MPEIKGTQTGVFSKIPRHESTHDKRYLETTYNSVYSKEFNQMDTKTFQKNSVFSGNKTGFKKDDKIKITSKLISEEYRTKIDPKYNSAIQRAWNYKKDAGISAVRDMNIDNTQQIILPPIDNELSINIGNGRNFEMLRSKITENCNKRFSDITRTTIKVENLRR